MKKKTNQKKVSTLFLKRVFTIQRTSESKIVFFLLQISVPNAIFLHSVTTNMISLYFLKIYQLMLSSWSMRVFAPQISLKSVTMQVGAAMSSIFTLSERIRQESLKRKSIQESRRLWRITMVYQIRKLVRHRSMFECSIFHGSWKMGKISCISPRLFRLQALIKYSRQNLFWFLCKSFGGRITTRFSTDVSYHGSATCSWFSFSSFMLSKKNTIELSWYSSRYLL